MTALGKCISTFSIPLIGSFDNAQHSYPYKTQDQLAFKDSQQCIQREGAWITQSM